MKRVLLSFIIVSSVTVATFGLSEAFFSDTETSSGNVLAAGAVDLTINSEDNPEAIVEIADLKPGDEKVIPKVLNVNSNAAFVWMHIKDLVSSQGVSTGPEELEEGQNVERHDIENFLTYGFDVDGSVLVGAGDEVAFPDVVSCWIPLGELPGNTDVLVSQSFHFDEQVTNWAQGDELTFAEEFYATQVQNNPGATPPDLGTGRLWSTETLSCNSNLAGEWDLTFTCVTGCSGVFPHRMDVATSNTGTGDFTGTGFYIPNPAVSWDILSATTIGASVEFRVDYKNINPGYFVDLVGEVKQDGTMEGTAASNASQTFTWTAIRI